jgi:predicted amidohydrolase
MKVAIGQMKVGPLDNPRANMDEACRLARSAAENKARLLLLPEGCLTGNALSSANRQPAMALEPALFEPLTAIARNAGMTICAGFATPFDGAFNVVQAILRPDGSVHFQRKGFRARSEPAFIKAWPDPARTPFVVDGVTVVITICSEFGEAAIMHEVHRHKPGLILHPSAGKMQNADVWSPATMSTTPVRDFRKNCRTIVEKSAAHNTTLGIPRVAANPVGFDGETWWPGNGYAVGGNGEILCWVEGENRPERQLSRLGFANI